MQIHNNHQILIRALRLFLVTVCTASLSFFPEGQSFAGAEKIHCKDKPVGEEQDDFSRKSDLVFTFPQKARYVYQVEYKSMNLLSSQTIHQVSGLLLVASTEAETKEGYDLRLRSHVTDLHISADEGMKHEVLDDMTLSGHLKVTGGMTWSNSPGMTLNELTRDVHARVVRACIALFPVLPQPWEGSPLNSTVTEPNLFQYQIDQPCIIRAVDVVGDERNGVRTVVISHFTNGLVEKGEIEGVTYMGGEAKTRSRLSVILKERGKTGSVDSAEP